MHLRINSKAEVEGKSKMSSHVLRDPLREEETECPAL